MALILSQAFGGSEEEQEDRTPRNEDEAEIQLQKAIGKI